MSRASAVPPRPSGGALQIGLLGPLQVRVGDRDVPVTGARSRVLLATLALAPGRSVRTDTIAAAVWGDAPPAGVANALQARVTQLRKALAAAGAGDVIATDPGAYRLASAPEAVDAVRFEQRLDAGVAALAAGDAAGAVDALREALALWRGDALADVVDLVDSAVAPDVAVAARRLDELRLRAVERRVEAELALDAHPAAHGRHAVGAGGVHRRAGRGAPGPGARAGAAHPRLGDGAGGGRST